MPVPVVPIGIIQVVVKPPALLAHHGAGDNEVGHYGEIAQLEQIPGDLEAPVVVLDLLADELHPLLGPLQPFVGPHDPHVVPHAAPDLVPVVLDDDGFVALRGLARLPGGNRQILPGCLVQPLPDSLTAPVRKDDALQKGIARQAVGPVQTRAGHLACRKEPVHAGLAVAVHHNSAAEVMGGGDDGNGLFGHVDAKTEAAVVDGGEAIHQITPVPMADVENHAVVAGFLELGVDRSRHDVPGGKACEGVVFLHEGGAALELQDAAFAADGLADQEGFGLGVEEAGGVKLDEFHVGDVRPGAPGHRDAVTRGDVGVGRDEVDFACPSRCQDREPRPERVDPVVLDVENVGSQATILLFPRERFAAQDLGFADEVNGEEVLVDPDILDGVRLVDKGPLDFFSGRIGCVEDPPHGMSSLFSEIEGRLRP